MLWRRLVPVFEGDDLDPQLEALFACPQCGSFVSQVLVIGLDCGGADGLELKEIGPEVIEAQSYALQRLVKLCRRLRTFEVRDCHSLLARQTLLTLQASPSSLTLRSFKWT